MCRIVLAAGPPRRLIHVYGPTESTTFATWHLVQTVNAENPIVPIGRPLSNQQVYILDSNVQPVPIGVAGELYIGGAGLALGYLNQPDQTARRFIVNPFSNDPDARLYRTGDLARYHKDGTIEFLNRMDRQVKLRGFRVEPGEIETVLRQHPAVLDGVVDLREDGPVGKRLVAWWIPRDGTAPESADLAEHLNRCLPSYMVPASIVPIDAFPMTSNRKNRSSMLAGTESWNYGLFCSST